MGDYIWRIENKDGKGAYSFCSGEGQYWGDYHPGPTFHDHPEGNYVEVHDNHRFGFSKIITARRWWCSLPDLIDWESNEKAVLVAFRVADCTDIVELKSQTMFKPNDYKNDKVAFPASWLHTKRMEELINLADKEFNVKLYGCETLVVKKKRGRPKKVVDPMF